MVKGCKDGGREGGGRREDPGLWRFPSFQILKHHFLLVSGGGCHPGAALFTSETSDSRLAVGVDRDALLSSGRSRQPAPHSEGPLHHPGSDSDQNHRGNLSVDTRRQCVLI